MQLNENLKQGMMLRATVILIVSTFVTLISQAAFVEEFLFVTGLRGISVWIRVMAMIYALLLAMFSIWGQIPWHTKSPWAIPTLIVNK
jgi:hypothetical protein